MSGRRGFGVLLLGDGVPGFLAPDLLAAGGEVFASEAVAERWILASADALRKLRLSARVVAVARCGECGHVRRVPEGGG